MRQCHLVEIQLLVLFFLSNQLNSQLRRLDMVGEVVKVDCRRLGLQEINTLDSDLVEPLLVYEPSFRI